MREITTFSNTKALQQQIKHGWPSLAIALVLPFVAAAIGGLAMPRALNGWYRTLRKPTWNPPAWLFAPVWTTLYLLMGVASWLVWQKGTTNGNRNEPLVSRADLETRTTGINHALTWYGVQLVGNALWPLLFFSHGLQAKSSPNLLPLYPHLLQIPILLVSKTRSNGEGRNLNGFFFI